MTPGRVGPALGGGDTLCMLGAAGPAESVCAILVGAGGTGGVVAGGLEVVATGLGWAEGLEAPPVFLLGLMLVGRKARVACKVVHRV